MVCAAAHTLRIHRSDSFLRGKAPATLLRHTILQLYEENNICIYIYIYIYICITFLILVSLGMAPTESMPTTFVVGSSAAIVSGPGDRVRKTCRRMSCLS